MNEAIVITAGIVIFFSSLVGAAVYSGTVAENSKTARFTACLAVAHLPAECSLASK